MPVPFKSKMSVTSPRIRLTALLLFFGLAACYLALSPGSVAGQGYTTEEMECGERIIAAVQAWGTGAPAPPPRFARHGPLPILFDVPFVALGKLWISPDFMMSFEPVLTTAALLVILFLWLRKFTSPRMSLLLTLAGAFGTMLWPYAYIGLEPKQSLFVLLAGYLGLAQGEIRSWWRLLLLAVTCGIAITLKSTGIVLAPAMAYVLYAQFRNDWRSRREQVCVAVLVVATIWVLGDVSRGFYLGPPGRGFNGLLPMFIDSPIQLFVNMIGIFGSPTKGFLVYAPILLISLFSLPAALRSRQPAAFFALIVTGSVLLFLVVLKSPVDEVWGSRYMHTAIAPLILCIGMVRPRFQLRREVALLMLAITGLVISFLGALYYYGVQDTAAYGAGQNTMEWLTGDPDWNEILFHERLFRTWVRGGTQPALWTPAHMWVWLPPSGVQPWKTLDLRAFSQPQAGLVHLWNIPKTGASLAIFRLYILALVAGPLLLIWVTVRILKQQAPAGAARRSGEFLPFLAARIRALCAFEEHAQNGPGVRRAARRSGEFLPFLAARIRALCAFEPQSLGTHEAELEAEPKATPPREKATELAALIDDLRRSGPSQTDRREILVAEDLKIERSADAILKNGFVPKQDTDPIRDLTLDSQHSTEHRKTLTPEELKQVGEHWSQHEQDFNSRRHWTEVPDVRARINSKITGDPNIDLFAYVANKYFLRHDRNPEYCLSLGSGAGDLERGLAQYFKLKSHVGIEISEGLVKVAAERAAAFPHIQYRQADLNTCALDPDRYDLIIAHQALHHVSDLEGLFERVKRSLKPDGIFMFDEYVGPSRFQWTDAQLYWINKAIQTLPDQLNYDVQTRVFRDRVFRCTPEQVAELDPSEAVRSDEILPLVEKTFHVAEFRPYGGTILHMLLHATAGNFMTEDGKPWLHALFELEDLLLPKLGSDFAAVICKRS